jgi:hypothetical protein
MAKDLAQIYIRAKDETGGAFDSVKRGAQGVGDSLSRVNSMLGALGVGLSAGAFVTLVKQSIDATAALEDFSDTTSLAVETLSSLQQTSRIYGHSFEMVTGTAQKFAKSVAEAAGGNKQLLQSFDALGISQERLRTSKFDDLYVEFAAKIAKAENRTYAIAHATDLAGKSAANAMPFFKDLSENGLAQARVSADQAAAAGRLGDEIGKLKNEFSLFGESVGTRVVPVLLEWIEKTNSAWTATGNLATALNGLANIGQFGDTAVEQIKNIDKALADLEKKQGSLDGWLAKPILGLRQSSLLNMRSIAAARLPAPIGAGNAGGLDGSAGDAPFRLRAPQAPAGAADNSGPQLIAQLTGQLAELNGESSEVEKVIRKLTDGTKQYTVEVQAAALAIAGEIDEKKRLQNVNKELIAQAEREIKAQEAWDDVLAQFNQTHSEYRQGLEFETSLMGMTETQREIAIAQRKLELDFIKQTTNANAEQYEQLKKIYDLERERLPGAVAANQAAKSAIEANKKMVEDAKRQYEQLTESLTDALLRGFESGKGFAENFRATLKNMFSTLILRPILQPIVQGAAGAVTSLLPGSASAGGMGGLSSLGSMFSGSGGISGAAGMLTGGFDSIFQGAGVGMGSQFLADIGNYGLGMPVVGGLLQMATGNVKGGAGTMIGGAIGSMFGPVGTVVGSTLGGLLGGGKKKTPAYFTAADISATATADGGYVNSAVANSQKGDRWGFEYGLTPEISELIRGIYTDIGSIGSALGRNTDVLKTAVVPFSYQATGNAVGPDAAGSLAGFQQNMGQISDQLALVLMPSLNDYAQANETATQTLVRLVQVQEQLVAAEAQGKANIAGMVRGLPGALGIPGLEGAKSALAMSEYVSPMDRLSSARGLLDSTYQSAMGGDLASVNAFPQVLQQVLSIGREVGASGPAFQSLFLEGNKQLNELLGKQQSIQADLLKGVDVSIIQASQDQIGELRRGFTAVVDQLNAVTEELRRLREAA